jgi:hypothetical protein
VKAIIVKVDQVPKDLQGDEYFIALRTEIETGMTNPLIVEAVCTHEAGHFAYAMKENLRILDLVGPEIHYDASKKPPFVGHAAHLAIEIPLGTPIEACARMLVAGGVASIEVGKRPYAGDQIDFELFLSLCDNLPQLDDPKLRDSVWQDAKAVVKAFLRTVAKTSFPGLVEHLKMELDKVLYPQ